MILQEQFYLILEVFDHCNRPYLFKDKSCIRSITTELDSSLLISIQDPALVPSIKIDEATPVSRN